MVKYVIVGKVNCFFYFKVEFFVDEFLLNLLDFKVYKIVKQLEDWEGWLKEICEEKGWKYFSFFFVWREFVD